MIKKHIDPLIGLCFDANGRTFVVDEKLDNQRHSVRWLNMTGEITSFAIDTTNLLDSHYINFNLTATLDYLLNNT